MNDLFAQGRGSTSILVNMQSIARDFGVSESQVTYFEVGLDVSKFRVIYDQRVQRAYYLPSNLPNNSNIISLETSGILTHTNGSVDLSEYAAKRGEYFHTGYTYGMNYTLETHNQTVLFGAGRYRWAGALPKQMATTDTPATAGGIKPGAWILIPAETITTPTGGNISDWMNVPHIREFTNRPYSSMMAAVQAAFDYAKANAPHVLDCTGFQSGWMNTAGNMLAENITILNGEFEGDRDFWIHNCTIRGTTFKNMRLMPKGGDILMTNCTFDGPPRAGQAGSIVFQHLEYYRTDILPNGTPDERASAAGDTDAGTFEIDSCVFRNGYFGILQQPSGGKVSKLVIRNLSFYDMMGDAIELNVVQKSFDDGGVIENIAIFNIDADKSGVNTPSFQSNWGIGIGLAGKSPYGYDAPDSQYVKNFAIRNVYAVGVRQVIHVEVGRDFTIENIYADPDNTVSRGSGLATATVYIVGSKRFTVRGIYGEPKPYGNTPAENIRVIMLQWGTNQIYQPDGTPYNPPRAEASNSCFDFSVSDVFTRTGLVWGGCSAGPNTDATAEWSNIRCKVFQVFGVATELSLSDIYCETFKGVGQPESGDGAFPDNYVRTVNTKLSMVNVNATDANGYGGQIFSRCRYTNIRRVGGNVAVEQWVNYLGSMGTLLGGVGNVYYPIEAAHGANGTRFPTGYEFNAGDVVMVSEYTQMRGPRDGTTTPRNLTYKTGPLPTDLGDNTQLRMVQISVPYTVVSAGVFIPDTPEAAIKAAAVGSTQLVQNLTPNATSSGSPWLYVLQFSPGCRITIPGAGPNGTDLNTWVVKSPYQTPPSDTGRPITMDIAHPIQTAVPAGTRIRATNPIVTRPALTWERSAYHGIAE